ncbi:MAG: FGGY family carbohydrate kinase [Actinomycetota bacterium]|nr:FGGY family carbohydrate kinase [Actinomycetota bacterium]
MTALLVIDVGTTGLRAALIGDDARILELDHRPFPPSTPFPGLVEFDATAMSETVLDAARTVLATGGQGIDAVGITNQRASTIVWDRSTGVPVGPGLGWQDLRTVNECITARTGLGLALAPNQSATKIPWLLDAIDTDDGAARERDLCFGTVDSWLVWVLSAGERHVTDPTNASVTGLMRADGSGWDEAVCDALRIPMSMLPEIVDTAGAVVAEATLLEGSPPITALAGDQQASLVGQGCVHVGMTKITFGTGGMLDVCSGQEPPARSSRSEHGTFPIVAWSLAGRHTWAREAIMLAAGSNVDWLREDLGLFDESADSAELAARCESSEGTMYVPALLGLGTPYWDYGARATLVGMTRGTTAAHVTRAVLEGVAHRGADLVEAARGDLDTTIPSLRIDGGMSRNGIFVQALATATQLPVEVSPVVDATTLGAGYLAGLAGGAWSGLDDIAASWNPSAVIEPGPAAAATEDRERWREAVRRSARWIPELTELDF